MTKISIDPITRLEGHGRIDLFLNKEGGLENAYLIIPELRGFEKFCEGRPVEEMPRITQRICGVCPLAHHMAAAKAGDAVYHVDPPPAAKKLREMLYASFFVVLLDVGRMEMQYAGAGHPAVLHQSVADDRIDWLESTTTLLGVEHPLPVPCSLRQVPIRQGDRILLYTDGLTEARNEAGAEFGRPGLASWFETGAGVQEDEFVERLCTDVHDYSRGRLQDDLLCLGIRLKPGGRT